MTTFDTNDVTIVIQGPTNYYKEILDNQCPGLKYIWSTWDDEPNDNLVAISNRMQLVVSRKPHPTGIRNINLQCQSSYLGAFLADTPWVAKTRSDLIWTNHKELLSRGFSSIQEKNSIAAFLNYKPSIREIHDFVCFSSKENALNIWKYRQNGPTQDGPEVQLAKHMMATFGKTYEELVSNMSFLNILMEKNQVDLFCLKYNVSLGEQCNTDLFGVPSFPKKND